MMTVTNKNMENNSKNEDKNKKKTRKRTNKPQLTRDPAIRRLIIAKRANLYKTPSEISRELGIPRATVYGVINRYSQSNSIDYKPLGGNLRSIIKEKHEKYIMGEIDKNQTITLTELQKKLLKEFPEIKHIGIVTLSKFLRHKKGFSLRKSKANENR
ncbi:hypothetical protein BD770DRAFT_462149 [Pilaira anomala]|nr:hypothetical protein BD770DRAFT_462149 [Pilaira anomala]